MKIADISITTCQQPPFYNNSTIINHFHTIFQTGSVIGFLRASNLLFPHENAFETMVLFFKTFIQVLTTLWKFLKYCGKSRKCWQPEDYHNYLILFKGKSKLFKNNLNHLTLSQTTNFGLFQTERVCRQRFQIWWK